MAKAGETQDRCTQYALDVVSGKITAGEYVRLACQRHLDDIEKSKVAPYKYYFDVEKSEEIINFAEELTIAEGEENEHVTAYPFQCFILGSLNGWRTKEKSYRRFRTSYVQLGRQNGKSFINGILACYYGNFDGYKYGKIFCTGKKSVRNFSLGMRQRLGIAIALLNTPELLILDEPINGLDPAGIVEIRNLLKILNKEYGMTILVSSHILEELYQTASEFILIDHGKIIEEISDYELNERCKRHIAIKTTDVQKTVLVLEENLHTDNFKLMPDGIIRLYDYLNDLETVASALAESHILVTGLSVSGDTLEDYFLSKIGGTKDVKSPKN